MSQYIQPGDKSIDFALAGAASADKKTLADFLIEQGVDKKYSSLGKIYYLYQLEFEFESSNEIKNSGSRTDSQILVSHNMPIQNIAII